jgi:hypothetical protein
MRGVVFLRMATSLANHGEGVDRIRDFLSPEFVAIELDLCVTGRELLAGMSNAFIEGVLGISAVVQVASTHSQVALATRCPTGTLFSRAKHAR